MSDLSQYSAFRVWWIPQIPGKPFEVLVTTYAAGIALCDVLADYDIFQYENRIKPDYANAGGVQGLEATTGDWVDIDEEDVETTARTAEPRVYPDDLCDLLAEVERLRAKLAAVAAVAASMQRGNQTATTDALEGYWASQIRSALATGDEAKP